MLFNETMFLLFFKNRLKMRNFYFINDAINSKLISLNIVIFFIKLSLTPDSCVENE